MQSPRPKQSFGQPVIAFAGEDNSGLAHNTFKKLALYQQLLTM